MTARNDYFSRVLCGSKDKPESIAGDVKALHKRDLNIRADEHGDIQQSPTGPCSPSRETGVHPHGTDKRRPQTCTLSRDPLLQRGKKHWARRTGGLPRPAAAASRMTIRSSSSMTAPGIDLAADHVVVGRRHARGWGAPVTEPWPSACAVRRARPGAGRACWSSTPICKTRRSCCRTCYA